jgi:hypothetical protein
MTRITGRTTDATDGTRMFEMTSGWLARRVRAAATTAESPAKRAAPRCWPQIGCPATRSFRGRETTHCENARVSVARGHVASAFHSGKDLISIYAVRDRKKAYG